MLRQIVKFIKRQIGYLKKKELTAVILFSWFPIAIPAVLIIRLIKPFILVRLINFQALSMGGSVRYPDTYWRCKILNVEVPQQRTLDFFYMGPKRANNYLITIWKRIFPRIQENSLFWLFYSMEWINSKIPGGLEHDFDGKTNVQHLLEKVPVYIKFNSEEEKRGEKGLLNLGIPLGAPIVGLLVRENAYMKSFLPKLDDSMCNCRNSDINDFILASEELVNRGYYVIRMGARASKKIESKNKKIIDYAFSEHRDEFLDIYIAKSCDLFISTATGFDLVPNYLFNKPSAFLNLTCVEHILGLRGRPVFNVKLYFDSLTGRRLSLRELFNRNLIRTYDYISGPKSSVNFAGNSQEDLRDASIEAVERLQGTWESDPEDEILQRRFWDFFPNRKVEIPAYFSAHFLRRNHEWFLE